MRLCVPIVAGLIFVTAARAATFGTCFRATPLAGYLGRVTTGPGGNYYSVGGTILNAPLTQVLGGTNGTSPGGRWVAAAAIQVYFGNPTVKQAEMIVNSSTVAPGLVGVYQVYQVVLTVPAAHKGQNVAGYSEIGGVSGSTTGPAAPTITVN
jgi:hypothetical protein